LNRVSGEVNHAYGECGSPKANIIPDLNRRNENEKKPPIPGSVVVKCILI